MKLRFTIRHQYQSVQEPLLGTNPTGFLPNNIYGFQYNIARLYFPVSLYSSL